MTEKLVNFFIKLFGGTKSSETGKIVIVAILSMLPIIELRGGLIAAALLNLDWLLSFVISYIFNLLPIPFILLFINWIFKQFKKTKHLGKLVDKMEEKVDKKKGQIEKFGYWGLFLFVAIPLPGTGAWTGALIAAVLGMNRKKSFFTIALGVLGAGIIMMFLSFGLLRGIIG
ncbi:MAG: small multi-drug export protein [Bacilli bacterium]|nr:small multi-drug export protein [Bacilli bacterium]